MYSGIDTPYLIDSNAPDRKSLRRRYRKRVGVGWTGRRIGIGGHTRTITPVPVVTHYGIGINLTRLCVVNGLNRPGR